MRPTDEIENTAHPDHSNVVPLFPNTNDLSCAPGVPRHDIAEALRRLADRAEEGKIDALAGTFSVVDGGMGFITCTPENHYFSMLGGLEELKDEIKRRKQVDDEAHRGS